MLLKVDYHQRHHLGHSNIVSALESSSQGVLELCYNHYHVNSTGASAVAVIIKEILSGA